MEYLTCTQAMSLELSALELTELAPSFTPLVIASLGENTLVTGDQIDLDSVWHHVSSIRKENATDTESPLRLLLAFSIDSVLKRIEWRFRNPLN